MTDSRSERWDVALLCLALALGIFLNGRAWIERSLQLDEHVSFWIADRTSPSNLLVRSVSYSVTPPLSFVLERISLELAGRREWALRLPGFLSYLGAIGAVWWIGRNRLGALAGGLAAIVLATHPAVLPVASLARPYSLGILLSVLTMHPILAGGPVSRSGWIGWSLANLALVQTHYLFAVVWLVQFACIVLGRSFAGHRGRAVRISVAVYALCGLSALPGLARVWSHREFLNWTNRTTEWTDLVAFALPLERSRWTIVFAAAGLTVPIAWLLVRRWMHGAGWWDGERWNRERPVLGWIAAWFVAPVLLLWVAGRLWLPSLAAERYVVVYVPALALLWGGVISVLRGYVAPLGATLMLTMVMGLGPRLGAATRPSDDATSLAWARAHYRPPCHLVLVSSGLVEMTLLPAYRDDAVFHDYVACRLGRLYHAIECRRLSLPMFWSDEVAGMYRGAVLSARASAGSSGPARVWFYAATDTDVLRDSADRMEALLIEWGGRRAYRDEAAGLRTACYEF